MQAPCLSHTAVGCGKWVEVSSLVHNIDLVLFFSSQHVFHRREPRAVSPSGERVLLQLSVQHLLHTGVFCKDLCRHIWWGLARNLVHFNISFPNLSCGGFRSSLASSARGQCLCSGIAGSWVVLQSWASGVKKQKHSFSKIISPDKCFLSQKPRFYTYPKQKQQAVEGRCMRCALPP